MTAASKSRDLIAIIEGDAWRMAVLRQVAALGLPDCWVAAGFLRTPVWDKLHGITEPSPISDIDVVYFDPADISSELEKALEAQLEAAQPCGLWSVRNQARMHLRNGDAPYRSTEDALRHWLEVPTAVGARLTPKGRVELLAPFGLEDLFGLVIRPTPHALAGRMAAYRERLRKKNWLAQWPQVRVVEGR